MAGGWDPDAFLTGELNELGLEPDDYGMYLDSYDWAPEQMDKMEYSLGIEALKGKFDASALKLDKEVSGTGFESSYMEEDAERSLYDQYFTAAGELEIDLAQDIFKERKAFKEESWDTMTWLMETDPELNEELFGS